MNLKEIEYKLNTDIQKSVFNILKDGAEHRRDEIFTESGTSSSNVSNVLLLLKSWGVLDQPKRGFYKLVFGV